MKVNARESLPEPFYCCLPYVDLFGLNVWLVQCCWQLVIECDVFVYHSLFKYAYCFVLSHSAVHVLSSESS